MLNLELVRTPPPRIFRHAGTARHTMLNENLLVLTNEQTSRQTKRTKRTNERWHAVTMHVCNELWRLPDKAGPPHGPNKSDRPHVMQLHVGEVVARARHKPPTSNQRRGNQGGCVRNGVPLGESGYVFILNPFLSLPLPLPPGSSPDASGFLDVIIILHYL